MPRVRMTVVRSVCLLILLTGLITCAPLYFFRSDAAAIKFTRATKDSSAPALLAQPDEERQVSFAQAYGKLPLSFEANRGQAPSPVKFISRGSGYSLFLTPEEAVLALSKPAAASAVLRMKLVGANPAPQVSGMELQPSKTSYFIGNDRTAWQTNVDSYARVSYREVYPGIDLLYYGNQQQLEYDFLVSPGARPEQIRLSFTGAEKLFIDEGGELVLRTAAGDVRQHRPLLYQEVDGQRLEVKGRYVMRGKQVGFQVREYDRSRALIIDPVLVYSTYLGGDFDDRGYSISVDAAGCAYVAGLTTSSDFPPPSPIQPAPHPDQNRDAFILKLNPAGTAILYATYLGGAADEQANSVAVDASGSAYVVGSINSADFPTKNALQASLRGKYDLFLTKLNPEGTALTYSTYLGGTNGETASGVAVDGGGNAYLTGHTDSTDFPVANALQDKRRGDAIFRSTDSGNTWNPGSNGLGAAQVVAFAVNPVTPSTVYAAADTSVFKSTDGGSSWKVFNYHTFNGGGPTP